MKFDSFSAPKIPVKVCYSGDEARAVQFRALAERRVGTHLQMMGFRGLKQMVGAPYCPEPGVEITVSANHDLIIVNIHADGAEEEQRQFYSVIDLRFFCRVGPAIGEIDETRYYWIDFGKVSGVDAIRVYPPGKILQTQYRAGSVTTLTTPALGDDFFEYVVTTPTAHSQTKTFSYTGPEIDGAKNHRIVMGYHFLSTHSPTNTRELLLAEIMPATYDGAGTNRILYDYNSGTMCWGRALQTWGFGALFGDGTGEFACYIYRVEYDADAKKYDLVTDTGIGFYIDAYTAITASSGEFTTDGAYEPMCLSTDVISLTGTSVSVKNCARHTPALWTFALDITSDYPTVELTDYAEVGTLERWEFSAGGFSSFEAGTYEFHNRATSDSWTYADTLTSHEGEGIVCTTYGTPALCAEHWVDNPYWSGFITKHYQTEDSKVYWEMAVKIPGHSYGYTLTPGYSITRGEYIIDGWQYCSWNLYVGCRVGGGLAMEFTKMLDGSLTGEFGQQLVGGTPGNNINFVYQEVKNIDISYIGRNLGPWATSWQLIKDTCETYYDRTVWSEVAAWWARPQPMNCSGHNAFELCHGTWPVSLPLDQNCGLPLDNYPGTLPALEWGLHGEGWWHPDPHAISESDTVTKNLYYVDGYSFDSTTYENILYLDDRTAHASHGLVVAAKSGTAGEWVVYHGDDGVTVVPRDKFEELEEALLAAGAMLPGEYIHDIGLI